MQSIEHNVQLRPYNSFRLSATARDFARFTSVEELLQILSSSQGSQPPLVIGGGSNILFLNDPDRLVLKNEIRGIDKIDEDDEFVYIRAGAGENWHRFVLYCIDNGYGGVENLSLIPGCVGASPMQNIGAYGVEIKDVFHELKALNIEERSNYTFNSRDCAFGYRESIFKNQYKDQFIILTVTFRLRKFPVYNTTYGAISSELQRMGIATLSLKAVSDAVISIRQSKLPDPDITGNAGSYFKNPEIEQDLYRELQHTYPGIPGYALPGGNIKLAAGWLIEHSGPDAQTSWKGYRQGDAGCHKDQALVLVNYGNATGREIFDLGERIRESVNGKFRILMEREVNII